jgi:PadR family transcriptional regulator, regulatory protein PadR
VQAEELKGHLDSLILSVISSRPMHGYAVIDELRSRSGGQLALPEGTVYPALHRLERLGLLSSSWSDGKRRRRVYALTRTGERELSARRTRWQEFRRTIEAVLV